MTTEGFNNLILSKELNPPELIAISLFFIILTILFTLMYILKFFLSFKRFCIFLEFKEELPKTIWYVDMLILRIFCDYYLEY